MSDAMKLALQLSAVDMLSGVVKRVKNNILALGDAGEEVRRDFGIMEESVTKGLKGIAIGWYGVKKAIPGIRLAGGLQQAMLGVEMNLAGSARDAAELKRQLAEVESTAIRVSANAPFSAEDVVRIENSLLKAGMDIKDVAGESGAAFAATALASLSGELPEMVGDSLARVGSMFRLEGGQYKDLSDWLVRVDDAAATSLPELIQGLKMAGSNAAALGISGKDALTTLGALSPLGDRAGSAYNNFLGAIYTKGKLLKGLKINLFESGKFVGMNRAVDMLKKRFGEIKNDEKRMAILVKIFGEEGGRAANTLINASKGFAEIEAAAKQSLSIEEKMDIRAKGWLATVEKIGGTSRTTLAKLFDPMLDPLTKAGNLVNKLIGGVGELAAKDNLLGSLVSHGTSIGVAGLALGGLGFGGYHLLKGGKAGMRAIRGAGGIKGLFGDAASTATGIAKGKAVQAATGVVPVFVTNWPGNISSSGVGGLADGLEKAASRGGGASWLNSLKTFGKGSRFLPAGAGLAATAGSVVAGGAAGYTIGTGINKLIGMMMSKTSDGKYSGDGAIGSWLYDVFHRNEAQPGTKNNINLSVTVDRDGRIFTQSDDMNTKVDADVKRGDFGGF